MTNDDQNNPPEKFDWNEITVIPNGEQIKAMMLLLLPPIFAFGIYFGFVSKSQVEGFMSLLLGLAPTIPFYISAFMVLRRLTRRAIIQRAADQPKAIVITDPKTAAQIPSPSVIDPARAEKIIGTPEIKAQILDGEANAIKKVA